MCQNAMGRTLVPAPISRLIYSGLETSQKLQEETASLNRESRNRAIPNQSYGMLRFPQPQLGSLRHRCYTNSQLG